MKHAFFNVLPFLILLVCTDSGVMHSFVNAGDVSSTSRPNLSSGFKQNSDAAPHNPSSTTMSADGENKGRRGLSLSELNGPFLMNQVAKEKAAVSQRETAEDLDASSSFDRKEVSLSTTKINPEARASIALQNGIVSPMRERLLADESNKTVNGIILSSVESERTRQEFAKLWWVNLWIQQLPSNKEDEHHRSKHYSHLGENISDELIETVVPERDAQPGENSTNAKAFVERKQNNTSEDKLRKYGASNTELEMEREVLGASSTENVVCGENKSAMGENAFISSGMWVIIDNAITFGLASRRHKLRISRHLRSTRKLCARLTGFHGLLSGKRLPELRKLNAPGASSFGNEKTASTLDDTRIAMSSRNRLDSENEDTWNDATDDEYNARKLWKEEERNRLERVKTIDRLIAEGQERLQQLICEKDVLQRRPNPLFNYSTQSTKESESSEDRKEASDSFSMDHGTSRQFKFPPDDLVDEYLEMIFWSRRLTKMNHTYLWKDIDPQDDDERIGEDLLAPATRSPVVLKKGSNKNSRIKTKNGGSGSWLLRQSIGKGPSLGEKIGESVERAAYKAVTAAVMSALARALSGLHGLNVLKNADISLMLENSPDLPPLENAPTDYAHDALKKVFRTKAKQRKKRNKQRNADREYIQKDAVTEMLLSQAQISAPLLQFFPQAWQRALLGNIITLSTAVISDFFDGLQFQILGYQLSFSFKPITQEDMINHLGFTRANDRRGKLGDFEAAVKATAQDIADELKFLDRWHERALGSGILRTQIANLIARVVLALVDDILRDSRMNLWSAHAGGPRIIAGLEYRTQTAKY